ncbi:MAG: nitroreductase family protein, partial [Akkermansia sp.]|nr:nitroreductase family protein [Akkermansia sp.]
MQETLTDIRTRRSCRKYRAEQITDAQLDAILEAATWTP